MVEETKVHPAQRYPVTMVSPYEYLGAIEDFDIIWLPDCQRILFKASKAIGDNWRVQLPEQTLRRDARARTTTWAPTPEQIEVAVAMVTCFAQDKGVNETTPLV